MSEQRPELNAEDRSQDPHRLEWTGDRDKGIEGTGAPRYTDGEVDADGEIVWGKRYIADNYGITPPGNEDGDPRAGS